MLRVRSGVAAESWWRDAEHGHVQKGSSSLLRVLLFLLVLMALPAPASAKHNERPTKSGAWVVPTGFRAYHLDKGLANGVATLLGRGTRNVTLLDMGAGKGLYVRMLQTLGLPNVTGYEGVHNIKDLTSGRVQQREFTVAFEPCVGYDVVMCLEVAEHIPRKLEPIFLSNLNCSARHGIIISWAKMHQVGTGHVNLRSRADVLKLMDELGFVPDNEASKRASEHATLPWFKTNILALHRRGEPSPFTISPGSLIALEPRTVRVEAAPAAAAANPAPASQPALDNSDAAANAIDQLRSGYAHLQARLDELKLLGNAAGAPNSKPGDVLLLQALGEQRKGLSSLRGVSRLVEGAVVSSRAPTSTSPRQL